MTTGKPILSPEERIARLEEENERLHAENEQLRKEQTDAAQAVKSAGGLATRVLLGRRLRRSFRDWLNAKSLRDPLPADESADVLAAIVRRVIRVGMVGLLVAVLPGAFLLWQNVLIREQNDAIRSQIEQQAEQIEQQTSDTLIVRRAQLLATIYEEECSNDGPQASAATSDTPSMICLPKAHLRARQEAVRAFNEIERGRGVRPNLIKADLRGADLSGANLSRAGLNDANFLRADLRRANFSEALLIKADLSAAVLVSANLRDANLYLATLRWADLTGADLNEADLSRADLRGADLTGADLAGANLRDVNLHEASLRGADLSASRNLTQFQVNETEGDAKTLLPGALHRPKHWTSEG